MYGLSSSCHCAQTKFHRHCIPSLQPIAHPRPQWASNADYCLRWLMGGADKAQPLEQGAVGQCSTAQGSSTDANQWTTRDPLNPHRQICGR
eukprot:5744619-Pyramimonas_sp.AAC.1